MTALAPLVDEPKHQVDDNECTFGCAHGEDIPRDRWTRPVFSGGAKPVPLTRVSTLSKSLDGPSDALMNWKAARAVEGMIRNRGLFDAATVALSHGDEEKLRELTKESAEVGRASEASMAGTANHDVLLSGLMGNDLEFASEPVLESLAALRVTLSDAGLVPILTEQFVANTRLKYGGSYDLLLKDTATGRFHMGDVKTGAKSWERKYPLPVAIQLAGYAHGQRWCPHHGWLRDPPVDLERGYLLSVPLDQGVAILDPIDLTIGWEGMQLASWVRTFNRKKAIH